jgi:hypothetical protein
MASDPDDLVDALARQGLARQRAEQLRSREARKLEPKIPAAPKRAHPERDLQRAIVGYINRFVQGVLVAAVVNEEQGHGDAEQRARFGAARRASGVLSGHPDLLCYLPGGRILLWECKSDKGRVSAAQHLVHAQLAALGHPVEVIRTLEAALEALVRAGVPVRGRMLRQSVPVQSL